MSTLRDFIASRRKEIKSEISKLRAELRELDVAEQAVAPRTSDDTRSGGGAGIGQKRPTIMGMIRDVLLNFPEGADSATIIGAVKDKFGVEVPRSSMSPQLSRLKAHGVLTMENNVWFLAVRKSQKDEAPSEVQSESAPNTVGETTPSKDLSDLLTPHSPDRDPG